MKSAVEGLFNSFRPQFDEGGSLHKFWPVFELAEGFFFRTGEKTHKGAHIRDPLDLKRLMIIVDIALVPCILLGMWNVGYQAQVAEGLEVDHLMAVLRGAWHFLPVYAVTLAAGGAAEMAFAVVRKHEINEGFLVTSLLYPLTLPPTIPLWMVAMGIVFGIVIGKEVFGGVGMNILNPALTARAFVFFTYPAAISGAVNADGVGVWHAAGYWWPGAKGDGWANEACAGAWTCREALVDGFTGATPLLAVANGERGTDAVQILTDNGWAWSDMALGLIPGSMGEVSAVAALVGAVVLVATGIASWRIMVGCVAGLLVTSAVFNGLAPAEALPAFTLPPHYHLVMGGFAFGAVFMATDPVSAAATPLGKLIYGFCIGAMCALVRVVNPAYPEGMMLAVLFMNVFAPLIDYFIVQRTTRRRVARLAAS